MKPKKCKGCGKPATIEFRSLIPHRAKPMSLCDPCHRAVITGISKLKWPKETR